MAIRRGGGRRCRYSSCGRCLDCGRPPVPGEQVGEFSAVRHPRSRVLDALAAAGREDAAPGCLPALLDPGAGGFVRPGDPCLAGRIVERGITEIEEANRFLSEAYLPAQSAFRPTRRAGGFRLRRRRPGDPAGILCIQEERRVGNNNTVRDSRRRLHPAATAPTTSRDWRTSLQAQPPQQRSILLLPNPDNSCVTYKRKIAVKTTPLSCVYCRQMSLLRIGRSP